MEPEKIDLRKKLKARLREAKTKRTKGSVSGHKDQTFQNKIQEEKVLGYRKQQEFGAKMRIKP